MTPHEALKAAIEERKAQAEAAQAADLNGALQLTTSALVFEEDVRATMAFWHANTSPAFVIRQCGRDVKVLERHAPMASLGALGCSHCRDGFDLGALAAWPCPDYRDLAEVYQINLGVSDE